MMYRKPILTGGYVLFILVLIEAGSFFSLSLLKNIRQVEYAPILKKDLSKRNLRIINRLLEGESSYLVHSPELGWTIKPSGRYKKHRANPQGIRGNREYTPAPSMGKTRIAAFGNSFTHCDQVGNDSTWQAWMERLDSTLETLNFGVPGYGLGQAYLRYRNEGLDFSPHIVLIGFMSENINRMVNVFRPFYIDGTGLPLTKPRFLVENDTLKLLRNPLFNREEYRRLIGEPKAVLSEIGKNDYHFCKNYGQGPFDFLSSVRMYKMLSARLFTAGNIMTWGGIYNTRSDAFQVLCQVVAAFHREAVKNNSRPVILIFPSFYDFTRSREHKPSRYGPLADYLKREGYEYIDLISAFEEVKAGMKMNRYFQGHYTPLSNKLVALCILEHLNKDRPLNTSEP